MRVVRNKLVYQSVYQFYPCYLLRSSMELQYLTDSFVSLSYLFMELPANTFQYLMDSFVSCITFWYVEPFFMVCISIFQCFFTNSLIIYNFWVCNFFLSEFIVTLYMMFSRKQFPFKGQLFLLIQLHFRVFKFTGLFNIFLLCVLIFDLMLGIYE